MSLIGQNLDGSSAPTMAEPLRLVGGLYENTNGCWAEIMSGVGTSITYTPWAAKDSETVTISIPSNLPYIIPCMIRKVSTENHADGLLGVAHWWQDRP